MAGLRVLHKMSHTLYDLMDLGLQSCCSPERTNKALYSIDLWWGEIQATSRGYSLLLMYIVQLAIQKQNRKPCKHLKFIHYQGLGFKRFIYLHIFLLWEGPHNQFHLRITFKGLYIIKSRIAKKCIRAKLLLIAIMFRPINKLHLYNRSGSD